MLILIKNLTNDIKFIYRFNGQRIKIPTKDFITFSCDSIEEFNYWNKHSLKNNSSKGIQIVTDSKTIRLLNKVRLAEKCKINSANSDTIPTTENDYNNATKIVDNVDKVVKSSENSESNSVDISDNQNDSALTEDTNNECVDIVENSVDVTSCTVEENVDTIEDTVEDVVENVESDANITKYTEEELVTKSKNELQTILDNMGVTYKKNNSASTLISLILSNQ